MTHVYLQRAGRPAARRREKDRRHHFRPIFYQKGRRGQTPGLRMGLCLPG
nr:MAG TPA: hypothetical protein [Caudoviricetes sp.]